jgi:hypothetical protein
MGTFWVLGGNISGKPKSKKFNCGIIPKSKLESTL